jgi:hypothetical protein
VIALFRDTHAVDDHSGIGTLDDIGGSSSEVSLDLGMFPWTLPNKPFEPFLISVHAFG